MADEKLKIKTWQKRKYQITIVICHFSENHRIYTPENKYHNYNIFPSKLIHTPHTTPSSAKMKDLAITITIVGCQVLSQYVGSRLLAF